MGLRQLQAGRAVIVGRRIVEWSDERRLSIQDVRISYLGRDEAVDEEPEHYERAPGTGPPSRDLGAKPGDRAILS